MYIPERRGSLKVLHENEVLSARMASLKTIPVFTLLLMVMTGIAYAGDGDGASMPAWFPQLLGV